MTTSNFMIGPIKDGLRKDLKPYATPEDSFQTLINSYQWRGRVVRRKGYKLLGRLKQFIDDESLGNSGASTWSFNIYSTLAVPITLTSPEIIPGSVIITMNPTTLTGDVLGYTISADCEVQTTSTAGLTTGDSITISGVEIVDSSGSNLINGGPYKIEVIDGTHFKLGVPSIGWGTWESGGTWTYTGTSSHQFFDQGNGTLAVNPPDPNNVGTINYLTGNVTLTYTGGPGLPTVIEFEFYPLLPVMGLRTQEEFDINQQTTIAFDTIYSYEWNGSSFVTLPSFMPVLWSGTNYQFFYSTNYAGGFWVTNSKPGLNGVNISNAVAGGADTTITTSSPHGFTSGQTVLLINLIGMDDLNGNTYVITVTGPNTFTIPVISTGTYISNGIALNSEVAVSGQDGIRYYGSLNYGGTTVHESWANYNPPIDTNTALAGALLIFSYRGYLVFLNTWEGNDSGIFNYGNRARWTQIGTPYYSLPVPQNPNIQIVDPLTMRDDLFGQGGANDAPTSEVIVAAGFIRDILVVYFERSTWRLRFVNNAQNPFVWERVNVEFGSSSTFSTILFDKGLMAIGNRGIVISDGNDTIRFDEKIPDDVFQIRQTEKGFKRVHGIRTFKTKLNYWTIPSLSNTEGIYPDQVLVFNYDTKNWSYFDDCFTTFGYFYPSNNGQTWNDLPDPWPSYDQQSAGDEIAGEEFEQIIAGNQQGFVLQLEQTNSVNDPSLSINDISSSVFTSINNNLPDGTWIKLSGIMGTTIDDGVSLNGRNFRLSNALNDPNTFTINEFEPVLGGNASGASYIYTIDFVPVLAGSVQINIGSLQFTDINLDGVLVETNGLGSGTIDYITGAIALAFSPSIASTPVIIRVVSASLDQQIVPVNTTGTYTGQGLITKISNINIISKIFNFFGDDKRSRLSKIDFYINGTASGQFTTNIFADSSNYPVNIPFPDSPQNNVVLTTISPYQVSVGDQTIFRLYANCLAQTLQFQLTLSDAQQAVDAIYENDIELVAMMISLRRGGRLP